jgi:MFS family permease
MKHPVNQKTEPRIFYGYFVVLSAFLVMLLAYGVRTSFGVFFKPMSAEFEWSRALTSGAVTLSMLAQGVWGILMGRVNDRIGSRWVITLCCFFLGLGLLLLSLTRSPWQLYLFYGVLVGIGMGGVFVALVSTVARWFVRRRGTMTGVVLAGIGIGTLSIAPLANWLIAAFGWRKAYVIIGILVLVAGSIIAQFLRRDPARMGQLPLGQDQRSQPALKIDKQGLSFKEAVRSRNFWMVGISFACMGYCTFTITVHLVPHITDIGFSSSTAAIILSITGGIQSIGGVAMGIFADRIGSKRIILISFVLVAAALFWLVPAASLLMLLAFAVIYSFGIGGGTAMESTIVAELFGLKSHGVILGVISFGFTIGGAVGPLVTGYLFDLTGNYRIGFLITAALGVVGLILTSFLRSALKLAPK